MNTRPVIESSNAPLTLSASFNQDASCFAVGSETGFYGISLPHIARLMLICASVYTADPCKLFLMRGTVPSIRLHYKCLVLNHVDFNAGVGAVEMLEKTNFIALVGGGRQPKFAPNKVS